MPGFVFPDIGTPVSPDTVEETGSAQAPVPEVPYPLLMLAFGVLGFLALRYVWQ